MGRRILLAATLAVVVCSGCSSADPVATTTSSTAASTTSVPSSTTVSSSSSSTPVSSTTTSTTTSTTSTSTSSTSSTSTSSTSVPEPQCRPDDALVVVDAAIEAARLPRGDGWSSEVAGSPFADRAVSGLDMAQTLGLDCGARAVQAGVVGSRFVIVSWTGPRVAYVVLADDQPDGPYRSEATVTILTEDLSGEFIGESQQLYAAQLESGATILIGHEDYSLAATAKSWQVAVPPPPDGETTLESERHAIDALRAAGARNVSVAQPPEFGSDEGYVQFITPQGQIGVADVAPASSFDPMVPRYLGGATIVEQVDGVDIRITEPGPDAAPWDGVIEVGFRCGEWSWILEPPGNGSGPELVTFARELILSSECSVSGAG